MERFAKLFEPGKIGRLQLKNRMLMAAMGNHWSEDGFVTQRHIDYYVERARGGVAMVTTEGCSVQYHIGKGWQQMSADEDKFIPGLAKLAQAIHGGGAKAAIQLHHAGAASPPRFNGGQMPAGPSAVHRPNYVTVSEPSRAMTREEIHAVRDCYIEAAVRGWKAGFDAVELHGAHHYLLAQFHSPVWNERDDEYGGEPRNRARLTMEIIGGIKDRVPDFPVICRLNGREYGAEEYFHAHGLTQDEAMEIAQLIEASGADAVHISAFGWGKESLRLAPASAGALVPLAAAAKRSVRIPVISVGRVTPEVGEEALATGKADFIAVGRALLADPAYADKIKAGRLDDIVPCISCWECLGQPRANICAVNARTGFEGLFPEPLAKAARAKKVFVVGGGPGGMEAARVAALRGHAVTLFEKHSELGGQLPLGDKPQAKKALSPLQPYQIRELAKAGVKVELSCEATAEKLLKEKPDAVIVATGCHPLVPDIKGLEHSPAVYAFDFLAGDLKAGNRVVIIGGELVGCEVADLLAEPGGRDITVLRRGGEFMTGTRVGGMRVEVLGRLLDRGVKLIPGVSYKEAKADGLLITDASGAERFLPADLIIIAAGSVPDSALEAELRGRVPELALIGDAIKPRDILNAFHEAFRAAYAL